VPDDAAGDAFVIERDLAGAHVARGEFKSITGVHRTFTAQLTGTWDGQTFTLVEDFVYDDGAKDQKTWKLQRVAPGEYTGTREDVVGTARGYQDGRAFRLEYDVVLPSESGKGRKVRFRDVLAKDGGGQRAEHGDRRLVRLTRRIGIAGHGTGCRKMRNRSAG
jgi:hypothetical protein